MTRTPESSWAGAQMIGENEEVEVIQEGGAPGEPVCLQASGVPKGTVPTKLSERRSIIIISTPPMVQGGKQVSSPPKRCCTPPNLVDGHSGVDPPPELRRSRTRCLLRRNPQRPPATTGDLGY